MIAFFVKMNSTFTVLKFEKSIHLSDKPANLCQANEDKNAQCVVSYACPETVTASHLAGFHVKHPDEFKVIKIISFSQYDIIFLQEKIEIVLKHKFLSQTKIDIQNKTFVCS